MIRQDFLMRALAQLADAIARALGQKREDPEQALETLRAAKAALPLVPGLLERTSAEELPALIGSPELREALADLFELESQLLKERGDPKRALAALRRTAALRGPQN